MKHQIISVSIVGVWNMPLGEFPLDQKWCLGLFGDPFTTQVGMGVEGIAIKKLGKPPQPAVAIGQSRMSVQAPTVADCAEIFAKVRVMLYEVTKGQVPLFADIGLNTEHEWVDLEAKLRPAEGFLAKRFVAQALRDSAAAPGGNIHRFSTLQCRMQLQPSLDLGLRIEPRNGRDDGFYVAVNDHRKWNKSMPEADAVTDLLKESSDMVRSRLGPMLFGSAITNA